MSFEIKVAFDKLPALDRSARAKLGLLVRKTALDIEELARELVPVDTGALKASIEAQQESPYRWVVTAGNEAVDYAEYVENGTTRQPPQPYLTPAADEMRGPFLEKVGVILREAANGQ